MLWFVGQVHVSRLSGIGFAAMLKGCRDCRPFSISLYALTADLRVNVDFTKEKARLTQAYAQLGPPTWNETDTYDAVFSMLDKTSRLPGRRVLIVAGSGLDSFSGHTLDDVEKKLESADVTVYAIGLGSVLRGAYSRRRRLVLEDPQCFNTLFLQLDKKANR